MYDDTDWTLISFEPKKPVKPVSSKACPHCGKNLGKGGHFHVKACAKKAGKS